MKISYYQFLSEARAPKADLVLSPMQRDTRGVLEPKVGGQIINDPHGKYPDYTGERYKILKINHPDLQHLDTERPFYVSKHISARDDAGYPSQLSGKYSIRVVRNVEEGWVPTSEDNPDNLRFNHHTNSYAPPKASVTEDEMHAAARDEHGIDPIKEPEKFKEIKSKLYKKLQNRKVRTGQTTLRPK